MKKLLGLLLLAGFMTFFVGCSSDDDGPAAPQFTIVGTWKVTGKLINNEPQDISDICVYKGNMKFVNGGVYVEDVWSEDDENPCHLEETIGGNWEKNGDSYTVSITTEGGESLLPAQFTPILEQGEINRFKISATILGTTTTLIFTKQ